MSRAETNKSADTDTHREIALGSPWSPEDIPDPGSIPTGDMPGDKVFIGPSHIDKARIIFPRLLELLVPVLNDNPSRRGVVVVCGGSGVGKSEIASVLSYYLNRMDIGSYTLSGDNYPHRIPRYNDAERLGIYRQSAVRGLIAHGQYTGERAAILRKLQETGDDANTGLLSRYPWLSLYQREGRSGLKNYLGTPNEIDFDELSTIISQFKNGASSIYLKRMGREETQLWYEAVDFSGKNVLVIEWTHGNNDNLRGVDIPILLNSTPGETLAHRKARNRDGGTDSPFTTMVLKIEQALLISQAAKAKLIVTKSGELITYDEFIQIMVNGQEDA